MNLAAAAKLVVIALLALALLVPVLMIQNLVAERQGRRNEAVAAIAEGWGKRQTISGPYLAVPYERHWTEIRPSTRRVSLGTECSQPTWVAPPITCRSPPAGAMSWVAPRSGASWA